MHTAAVARWPVDVPLALSATVSPKEVRRGTGRGAGQRFRRHAEAMDIPPIAGTVTGPSVAPRSGEAARGVSAAVAISGLPGAVAKHLPPAANATGPVATRRAAFRVLALTRRPAVRV